MRPQTNARARSVSGHVYVEQRKKGPVWYWKLRLPDGGEERKAIGPEWTGRIQVVVATPRSGRC
jgi:hypothetical protein